MSSLSVVIPNFNHAEFLSEVVASCLDGSESADEVIVVDDDSTDSSLSVLRILRLSHSRLRVIEHGLNRGPAAALNTGLHAARSEWVLLRAADDLCPRNSLETFRKLANDFPDAGVITGDVVYFEKNAQRGVCERLGRATEPVHVTSASYLDLYGGNIIHGSSTFCRTEWARSAGGLDEALRWHCDWFLLLALGLARGFVYAPSVFGAMRLNPQSYNAVGTAVSDTQTRVLRHLLAKLEQDAPLRRSFLSCGCLDFFGESLEKLVRSEGGDLCGAFAPVLEKPRDEIIAARRETGLASVFLPFLVRHSGQIREHAGSVAIYGAGGHTRRLLEVWRESGLPMPAAILDGSATHHAAYLDGIPVCKPVAVAEYPRPLVILSSKSYEPLLASTMEALIPQVPYLKIWGGDDH